MLSETQATFHWGGSSSLLLLIPVFIPMLASALIYPGQRWLGRKCVYYISFLGGLLPVIALVLLIVDKGQNYYFLYEGFINLQLLLRPDSFGIYMALLAAVIWFFTTVYGIEYMEREHKQARFFAFFMLSLGGTLGVFLAGDLFTLFLLFELMTLASFPLVIHEENPGARRAGKLYLYLGVMGGLAILMGLMLLYHRVGTLDLRLLQGILPQLGRDGYIILPLLYLGFAIKAGLIPLHIWLPQAHPVAPTPASAVLSALLIKCGVYGIVRLMFTLAPLDWLGAVIFWIGLGTMVFGSLMAFFESSSKKLLAYSSVSQIGYITIGLGAGAILGSTGAMGALGSIYHVMNHALFKSSLFMAIGYVYVQTHELNIYKLGGLWRKMPLTTALAIVGALGLVGFPLFNGYPSKTFIHHAIVYAEHETHQVAYRYAEMFFNLGAAGTAAYAFKLIYNVFFGSTGAKSKKVVETNFVRPVFVILILMMVCIGFFPTFVLENTVLPLAGALHLDVDYAHYKLGGYSFFGSSDLQDAGKVLILGVLLILLYGFLSKRKIDLPRWLSIESMVFEPAVRLLQKSFADIFNVLESLILGFGRGIVNIYQDRAFNVIAKLDGQMNELISPSDLILDGSSYVRDITDGSKPHPYINALIRYWEREGQSEDLNTFWNWLTGEGIMSPRDVATLRHLLEQDEGASPERELMIEQLFSKIMDGDVRELSEKLAMRASTGSKFTDRLLAILLSHVTEKEGAPEKSRMVEKLLNTMVDGDVEELTDELDMPKPPRPGFVDRLLNTLTPILENIGWKTEKEATDSNPETSEWGRWSLFNLNFDMIILGVTLLIAVVLLVFFTHM